MNPQTGNIPNDFKIHYEIVPKGKKKAIFINLFVIGNVNFENCGVSVGQKK